MLAASLIPALLMFFILTPSFLFERTQDIEKTLEQQGKLLITQLSHVSEYAILTGNTDYLANIIEELLKQPEIYAITIQNTENKVLLKKNSVYEISNTADLITYEQPVTQVFDPATFDIIEGLPFTEKIKLPKNTLSPKTIGHVQLTLSKRTLHERQNEIIVYGVLLALIALLLSGFVGHFIGKSIVRPTQAMVAGVKRLGESNYTTPIGEISNNELGALALGINALANKLNDAKSEIEKTINELTEARDEADRINASKSDFLALISHEIRSPLNSAFGVIQLLNDTKLTKPQRRYIELALNSFNHLVNLLDDIIDFSTLDYGEIKIEPQPTAVKQIIEQVISNYQVSASQKSLDLIVKYSGDARLQEYDVYTDPTRLRQVLSNLIDNAIKYTHIGSVHIHVHWLLQEDSNVLISMAVQDTGVGIEQDRLQSVFEMFSQGAAPSTRGYGGVGLGLYIVKRLVKLLGGKISARSQIGIGTMFHLELPTKLAEDVSLDSISGLPSNQNQSTIQSRKILVVEDDFSNQEVISGFLKQVGIHVEIASSGLEGLNLFKENIYDLVFIDCFMPNMDGFELAEKMRQHESKHCKFRTPLVAITASALPATHKKCLESGMDDIITKPYRKFELYKRISAICKTDKILSKIMSHKASEV
ncbi:MAG: response regulator [Gammaproteobacteria bacterium]|nr:response regulator [Gammaproteobacteria bacterium]